MKNVKSFPSAVASGSASHLNHTNHKNRISNSNTKHVKEKISGGNFTNTKQEGSMSLQKTNLDTKFYNSNKSNSDNRQQPLTGTKNFLDLTSEKENQEISEILMDRDFTQKLKKRKGFMTQPESQVINTGDSKMLKAFDSISYYSKNQNDQSNFSGESSKALGHKYTESDLLSDELENSGETSYSNTNLNEVDNEKFRRLSKTRLINKKRKKETLTLWNFIKKTKTLLQQKAQQLQWRKKIQVVAKLRMNLRKWEVQKERKCLKVKQTKQILPRRE